MSPCLQAAAELRRSLPAGSSARVDALFDNLTAAIEAGLEVRSGDGRGSRGLHSFPFQLNLSSSVHRITQINL